jgi:hypothetical protein
MLNTGRSMVLWAGVLVVSAGVHAKQSTDGLSGAWAAPEYKVTVSSDSDFSIWGRGSSKVRNIDLSLQRNGEGILRVHKSVVDAQGKTKPYSASVVEVRLKVEMPDKPPAGEALRPAVTVLGAEERYLDGGDEPRTIEGLKVSFHIPATDASRLNIRYDTAEGRGSFGESLNRHDGGAASSSAQGSHDSGAYQPGWRPSEPSRFSRSADLSSRRTRHPTGSEEPSNIGRDVLWF